MTSSGEYKSVVSAATAAAHRTALWEPWQEQGKKMKEAESNRHVARFYKDNQFVSLHPGELDPIPAAPRMLRHVQAILIFMAVFFSVLALSLVALQTWRPEQNEDHWPMGNKSNGQEVDNYQHSVGVAEKQEATQRFRDCVESSSTWQEEIQMLKYQMDNVSSQVQLLGDHLEDASADIQQAKGMLKDSGSLALETQALRGSLELASADIHNLRGDLEKVNAMTSQTQGLLKSSTEHTSAELHILGKGLEEAQTEIQALRGSLQSSYNLSSQTQSFLQRSVNNTSAEIQAMRDHLERADDGMNSLKKDLETVIAQTQKANGHLEQTDAQIQVLKAELKSTSSLNSRIEAVSGQLKDTSRELQTLRGDLRDVTVLKSNIQTLQSNLQKAQAEMQSLKTNLEATKALTAKIQKEQSRLGTLQQAVASQEQVQRNQNQLLQLILQGWKAFRGSLYYVSLEEKSWHEAEKFCVSHGAHLASVTSQEERPSFLGISLDQNIHWLWKADEKEMLALWELNSRLNIRGLSKEILSLEGLLLRARKELTRLTEVFLVKFTSNAYHWIGLTDQGMDGNWRWVDGTPFNHGQSNRFWERNQPDNWRHVNGEVEECVHMKQQWNDMLCGATYPWVCEKSIGQTVA